ncbi:MAG: hypothetical protein OXE17_13050 [Chloroflexi bacterium]|nr:hypothetical protein [Chloroflexota bacterium]
MPGKGKRVASRQAQLNRRRRRQGRVGADAAVETAERGSAPVTASVAAPAPAVAGVQESVTSGSSSSQGATVVTVTPERPVAAARGIQSLAYNNLGRELRRILILAGVLLVALFVISFLI